MRFHDPELCIRNIVYHPEDKAVRGTRSLGVGTLMWVGVVVPDQEATMSVSCIHRLGFTGER